MQLADQHEGTTTKAFAGLRVLDFSTTIAGPHCARMLADMGAEVIKIETDGGETMRISGADIAPGRTMAVLGEHTDELRDEIGLTADPSIPAGRTAVQN